ncbi:hypothetical protein K488DRAFT_81085 [Vararia minispora EC-137]|uniref:Uncharacterized protein n=1 Tax=Vararia minispora EC-137 TaxID=1314806 RepID=A0ACB8Q7L4_9AGAM|nr:hypothetical protein K488DRAFT_81085 [Vararia minispora EC-137]
MATEQITLYTAKVCPWAQRVELAFKETNAKITRYEIDLGNKPSWYPKVNPVTKVPAVAYGGPIVSPEEPSPESVKIAESAVLLEFAADLYPHLLPPSPAERARARFVIDAAATKAIPAFFEFVFRGPGDPEALVTAFDAFQQLLPPEGFAVGNWSIADAAIAPFIGRLELALRNDVGKYAPEDGKKVYAELFQSPRFARLQKYWQDVSSRESWKSTFDEAHILERLRPRLARA